MGGPSKRGIGEKQDAGGPTAPDRRAAPGKSPSVGFMDAIQVENKGRVQSRPRALRQNGGVSHLPAPVRNSTSVGSFTSTLPSGTLVLRRPLLSWPKYCEA